MRNALTIDVEDYFQVSAFEHCIPREQWENWPPRVKFNTERVLDILDTHTLKGTFFVLGWVAKRYPELVRRMHTSGHEVACHGYSHKRITTMTPEEFRQDIDRARKLLQDISGQPVEGYRAPSYTITSRTLWALDALIDSGFTYDSSIFPIRHDIYGMPGAQRFPHRLERPAGTIKEFPPTTFQVSLFGKTANLPVAGGGYLRLLPVSLVSATFKHINQKGENGQGSPCVLYFHPWEIDPGQPRIPNAPLKSRFRHYLNLERTETKLNHLFRAHNFAPMASIFAEELAHV